MRRCLIAILVSSLVFLSACAKSGQNDELQSAMDFRAKLLNSGGAAFVADVTADYGDEVYSFTLDCVYSADGMTEITVTAPDTLSGIRAQIENDTGKLSFGDTELSFGTLANGLVTPLSAPAVLGRCWQNAYISCAGKEEKNLRVSYSDGYEANQLLADTWFSAKMIPIYAELCYNDTCILKLTISDFDFLPKS